MTLLERAGTNLALYSATMSNAAWKTGELLAIAASTVTDPAGGTAAWVVQSSTTSTATNHTAYQTLTAATGTVAGSMYLRAGDWSYARVGLYNATDGFFAYCAVDLSNGSAIATLGTTYIETLANGWYRVMCVGTPTIANSNLHLTLVSSTGIVATVTVSGGYVHAFGPMAELAEYPSSYYPTTSAAATRNTDALAFPWTPVPQAMWVYAKFTELGRGTQGAARSRVFAIGTAASKLDVYATVIGSYIVNHTTATSSVTASATVATALGDTVEVLAMLATTGAVTISVAVNGGTATTSSASSAQTLPAAWGAETLRLNGLTTSTGAGLAGYRHVKIGIGTSVNTLALARAV
jgi:hypothetical protein